MVASVSNESLASISVETRPGIIFKISTPKFTASLSRAFSTFEKSVSKLQRMIKKQEHLLVGILSMFFTISNRVIDQAFVGCIKVLV
jgi:hypothetical protein